jgi:tetratricopeptide (TPR) repeat protein
MKTMFAKIHLLLVSTVLALAPPAMASSAPLSEAQGISEAVQLYSEATTLQEDMTRKSELLGRAETILLKVIADNPESLDAHRKLMGVYLQMRDYSKAIRVMQTAISLSPEDPKLFVALAILYDHQGAYEYASAILDEALALDPQQQLAVDYKKSIQQKIELRKTAMQSGDQGRLHSR